MQSGGEKHGMEHPATEQIMRHAGRANWYSIEQAVGHLIGVMTYNHYRPKRILAIGRGGLIPGTMLSHLLEVPVTPFMVESYKADHSSDKVRFILPFKPKDLNVNYFQAYAAVLGPLDTSETLIIDDLWDSGATMEIMKQSMPSALTATLFYKSEEPGRNMPPLNFPGLWLPKAQWVYFPWEK